MHEIKDWVNNRPGLETAKVRENVLCSGYRTRLLCSPSTEY